MKKTGSFFFHLVLEYIIRTVVVLAIFLLLTILAIYMAVKAINLPHVGIEKHENILFQKQFNKINIEEIAGRDGSLEILDENLQVVYPKDSNSVYTVADIESISHLNYFNAITTIEEFYDDNNQKKILIVNDSQTSKSDKWFLLLDKSLTVIDSGGKYTNFKQSYTQEQLDNLGESKVYKYTFNTKDNKEYTMIINMGSAIDIMGNSDLKHLTLFPIIFIVSYLICVVLFMVLLSRKVKRPLVELNNAMLSYSKGELKTPINYKGPNEIVNIGNTFNDMVLKLRDSELKNKQLAKEKQRILVDISHDLKTPITSIKGYTKALADGKVKESEYQKYFNIINDKTQNLTNLINLFHDYSKMDHPDFKMDLKPNDLSIVLRNILATNYQHIVECGFILKVNIPEQQSKSKVDVFQFNRSIENILNNALEYNPSGTTIMVQLAWHRNSYQITIADNGVGIAEDIADHIFEPFVVGDDSRGAKHGSGLGLAISKKIIEAHNGTIDLVVNNKNKYKTQFVINMPRFKK
ncbi:HAMP domain-containing histidine kinase [Clostridium sp. 'deep sea']|uniref:HAMP domain-containing sensor histidine kinase n=1 Tax=Clostridium sp. 'deep sea' TaxID=2779445 RepID=UPI0018965C41|nr:HAMP domain-containing sensor histidine kinase [Clostridium sp. 'deep sea']QOR34928.1 HAMP domain-containing histidine kinase [Clostridium sp. 'deep sea']